jgi:hypothetical protein
MTVKKDYQTPKLTNFGDTASLTHSVESDAMKMLTSLSNVPNLFASFGGF